MEDHVPEDWNPDPKLMSKIVDLNYALFAQDLNSRWKILCRKIKVKKLDFFQFSESLIIRF